MTHPQLEMYSTQLFEAMQFAFFSSGSFQGFGSSTFISDRGYVAGTEPCTLLTNGPSCTTALKSCVLQNYGFYCALPSDPSRTHMVCRRLPQK
ncbi:hypothetical protein ID866_4536 [Astraeus odoratus]|nr:hypothetical protein ID866_4536 [Astraeus odoratus]